MVGQRTLNPFIFVRLEAPEPGKKSKKKRCEAISKGGIRWHIC